MELCGNGEPDERAHPSHFVTRPTRSNLSFSDPVFHNVYLRSACIQNDSTGVELLNIASQV